MKIFIFITLLFGQFPQLFAFEASKERVIRRLMENYDPTVTTIEGTTDRAGRKCSVKDVTVTGKEPLSEEGFPLVNSQKKREVQLRVYQNKNWQKDDPESQTIVLLAPTGGVNILDKNYAKYFCKKLKTRVVIIVTWGGFGIVAKNPLNPLAHDWSAIRSFWAIRHTLEYIDEDRVKIFGTSVGGILAALALGVEKRLTGGILLVAGSGMEEIITVSSEENLTNLRAVRRGHYNLGSMDEYREFLRGKIEIDPNLFADELKEKDLYLVVAEEDTTVPTKNQNDLVELAKPRVLETINSSHIRAILWSSLTKKREFTNFLRQQ